MPSNNPKRDFALQLKAVREFARRLAAEPQAQNDCRESTVENHSKRSSESLEDQRTHESHATRRLFDVEQYNERLRWLKARSHSHEDGRAVPLKELERALAMGPVRKIGSAPPDSALQEIQQSFLHCSQVVEHVRRRSALARLVPNAPLRLPPMLLTPTEN